MDFNMCQLHSRGCNRQSMQSSPMAASRNFFFSNFSSFVSCFLKPNLFASASSLSFSARCAANRSSKLLSRTLRISKIIKKRKQECYQMSDNTNLLRKNWAVRRTAVRSPVGTSTPIWTIACKTCRKISTHDYHQLSGMLPVLTASDLQQTRTQQSIA